VLAFASLLVWWKFCFAQLSGALSLFVPHLVANALWSWVFFAWRLGALAVVEVLVLWGLVAATVVAFGRIQRVAALLLLPYLAWVSFAAALTLAVWRRNPGLLG
jgi:tryptophan-rich sensory protein